MRLKPSVLEVILAQACRSTVSTLLPSKMEERAWETWGEDEDEDDLRKWDELEELDYENLPAGVAEEEFVRMLVDLKWTGVLSARQVCTLAFWASRAGARGSIAKLAERPDAQTGKFARRFDKVIGTKPADVPAYNVPTIRRPRTSASRTLEPIPVILPIEAVEEELEQSLGPVTELREAIAAEELPPFYTQHPLVRDAPPNVDIHPVALYMDGVSFQRQDGVLGIWLHMLLSTSRHLLCVVRKSELCTCGCKGW